METSPLNKNVMISWNSRIAGSTTNFQCSNNSYRQGQNYLNNGSNTCSLNDKDVLKHVDRPCQHVRDVARQVSDMNLYHCIPPIPTSLLEPWFKSVNTVRHWSGLENHLAFAVPLAKYSLTTWRVPLIFFQICFVANHHNRDISSTISDSTTLPFRWEVSGIRRGKSRETTCLLSARPGVSFDWIPAP
jgi:hypothetical protein